MKVGASSSAAAFRILIEGRVQGVGFRPFISRLAEDLGLCGWVLNDGGVVKVHVEGQISDLKMFQEALIDQAPPLALPSIGVSQAIPPEGFHHFEILKSRNDHQGDRVMAQDQGVCKPCLLELKDPQDRRYRYPFIHCTQCGPRYTVIHDFPYDRLNTVMADFPLCISCQKEYENPIDRRYHAEAMACPQCGPVLSYRKGTDGPFLLGEEALQAAIDALGAGDILAVKGMGGYHLMLDAHAEQSIERLRLRKNRPQKPLAVLVSEALMEEHWPEDGTDARRLAREKLLSPERPIVLMPLGDRALFPAGIAPGLQEIGILLCSTPLQALLLDGVGRPLIATSGNISGEPVFIDPKAVDHRLLHVADGFLHHDRDILRPADDGVYRVIEGRPRPLRIGRGGAPLEWRLKRPLMEPLLAVGADLKNTFALCKADRVIVSPHLGDLGSPRGLEVFETRVKDFERLYGIEPRQVVVDQHPGYFSRQWALDLGLPLISVGHHHAHASAVYGEWGGEGALLVFTFDGLGYGEDGTLWGGETLLGRPGCWERVGCPRSFHLVGGASASREPWRSALALLFETGRDSFRDLDPKALVKTAWRLRINTHETTSVGRLFDAAAALMGLCMTSRYEGEAPMLLEALAEKMTGIEGLSLPIEEERGLYRWDWSPLIDPLMDEGRPLSERAGLFHETLARLIGRLALRIREGHEGITAVALTGGVFQNRFLTESAIGHLKAAGFKVFLPEIFPVNDGGISFGQVIEAQALMSFNEGQGEDYGAG